MNTILIKYSLFIILFIPLIVNAEEEKISLTKNPFVKPIMMFEKSQKRNEQKQNANISLSGSNLKATLSAGEDSIANIDGELIFVGDEYRGYKLVSVGEGVVKFMKNGNEIILSVSEKHEKLSQ